MQALQQATHLHRRPTSSSSPIRVAAAASQRLAKHQANRQRELVATMSATAVQELDEQRSNGNGLHAEQPFPLMMVPLRQTKTIHFIRHGQGFHNVAGHANHDNYKSEEWWVNVVADQAEGTKLVAHSTFTLPGWGPWTLTVARLPACRVYCFVLSHLHPWLHRPC